MLGHQYRSVSRHDGAGPPHLATLSSAAFIARRTHHAITSCLCQSASLTARLICACTAAIAQLAVDLDQHAAGAVISFKRRGLLQIHFDAALLRLGRIVLALIELAPSRRRTGP